MKNKTQYGVLTIIGGFLIHILNGTVYSWGNLNPYLISYLKISNPDLEKDQGFFFFPFAILFSTFTVSLGGYMESKINPRYVLVLGSSLIILSHVGLYMFKSLFLDYLSMSLYGLGIGINYLPPVRTAWKYFSGKHKGKVVGIIVCGFGVSASFANIIAELIINPESKNMDSNGYFPEDVAKNVPTYILYALIAFCILAFLGICLVIPYRDDSDEYSEKTLLVSEESSPRNKRLSEEVKEIQYLSVNSIFDSTDKHETLGKAICSKRFAACFSMAFFTSFFLYLIVNTFRSFAGSRQSSSLLSNLAVGFSLGNGLFRPIWGLLFDKFSFKFLFVILNLLQMIIAASVYFMVENSVLFSMCILFCGCLLAGLFAMFPSLISKIFGLKLSSEVYGVNFLAFGISGFIGPIFIYIIHHSGLDASNEVPFLVVYMTGAFFSLISIIICLFTNFEKFKY